MKKTPVIDRTRPKRGKCMMKSEYMTCSKTGQSHLFKHVCREHPKMCISCGARLQYNHVDGWFCRGFPSSSFNSCDAPNFIYSSKPPKIEAAGKAPRVFRLTSPPPVDVETVKIQPTLIRGVPIGVSDANLNPSYAYSIDPTAHIPSGCFPPNFPPQPPNPGYVSPWGFSIDPNRTQRMDGRPYLSLSDFGASQLDPPELVIPPPKFRLESPFGNVEIDMTPADVEFFEKQRAEKEKENAAPNPTDRVRFWPHEVEVARVLFHAMTPDPAAAERLFGSFKLANEGKPANSGDPGLDSLLKNLFAKTRLLDLPSGPAVGMPAYCVKEKKEFQYLFSPFKPSFCICNSSMGFSQNDGTFKCTWTPPPQPEPFPDPEMDLCGPDCAGQLQTVYCLTLGKFITLRRCVNKLAVCPGCSSPCGLSPPTMKGAAEYTCRFIPPFPAPTPPQEEKTDPEIEATARRIYRSGVPFIGIVAPKGHIDLPPREGKPHPEAPVVSYLDGDSELGNKMPPAPSSPEPKKTEDAEKKEPAKENPKPMTSEEFLKPLDRIGRRWRLRYSYDYEKKKGIIKGICPCGRWFDDSFQPMGSDPMVERIKFLQSLFQNRQCTCGAVFTIY